MPSPQTLYVVSPQAQVSWNQGVLEIRSEAGGRSLRTEDTWLVAVLDAFSQPTTIHDAVQRLPALPTKQLGQLLGGLKALGALVPQSVLGSGDDGSPDLHIEPFERIQETIDARTRELPFLKRDDLGLTVSNCGKETLSPGCQACKDGGWVCFYAGFRCNAVCGFCPQPDALRRRKEGPIGDQFVAEFCDFLLANADRITGISLSGGELFLYRETAERVLSFIREHVPDMYVWAYTNGIALTPAQMQRFAELGLNELRFDLAASDFDDAIVQKIADHAVPNFPWVTVEVPAIQETVDALIGRGLLARLAAIGVKQLNLAQLCVPEGDSTSPAYRNYLTPDRVFYRFEGFKPDSGGDLYALDSRLFTYDVMDFAHREGIDIRINDCSSDAKEAQRLARATHWGADVGLMKRHSYPTMAAPGNVSAPPESAQRTSSGVAFEVLRTGTGSAQPGPADYVTVHYTGWTTDGKMFDSSELRHEPLTVCLLNVVPGWSEGVRAMVEGERRRLWIPGDLAYAGRPGKPQGMLVFDIELQVIHG